MQYLLKQQLIGI